MINLTAILVANGIGIASVLTTVFSSRALLGTKRKDISYVWWSLALCFISCIVDPVVFLVDGKAGAVYYWINMIGNTFLYHANVWLVVLWIAFLLVHLNGYGDETKLQIKKLSVIPTILTVFAVINMFVPLIFTIGEDNVYRRKPLALLYWSYIALYLAYSIVMYLMYRQKENRIRVFPIGVFVFPLVIGAVIQLQHYGLSLTWPSVAVAMSGVIMSMEAEVAFVDQLTGLNNRTFLFSTNFYKKARGGIMLDINNFKSINDTYGHAEGDRALTQVGNVLSAAISGKGFAIRYAGDEFVLFTSSGDLKEIESVCTAIHQGLDTVNQQGRAPYQLTVSCGFDKFDPEKQTIDELIHGIDARMYQAKKQYYSEHHDRRQRRD